MELIGDEYTFFISDNNKEYTEIFIPENVSLDKYALPLVFAI